MKHTLTMTIILVLVFFAAQIVGLFVINNYIDHKATSETGKVSYKNLPYSMDRPELPESTSYLWIFGAILAGTVVLLVLMRFGRVNWLKVWFTIAIVLCLSIALSAFMPQTPALIISIVAAYIRIFRKNIIVHNLTEILLYGGLAAIFVPVINMFSAFMMLLLISVYDMIAVWGSKHMVKLATFQAKADLFAGVFIPYSLKGATLKSAQDRQDIKAKSKSTEILSSHSGKKATPESKSESKNVILGGGDIGFPLIFTGVVMKSLMLANTVFAGFLKTLILPVTTSLALLWLLLQAKKDRFYPAMPFISAGCIVGWLIITYI